MYIMNKNFSNWLAVGFLVLSFVYLFAITFVALPQSSVTIVSDNKQTLLSAMLLIVGYYWGSSHGKKDEEKKEA